MNKKKIFNDPVYGFITAPTALIFDIIEHPYFQRLRRIKQLGLTEMVYPGALHTRFHHALGAMHLMDTALQTLRSKNNEINDSEYEASLIAILLHDVGHGPFSHALETAIFKNVHHEHLSLHIMHLLNEQFGGRLSLAIDIFKDNYHRRFFHQLVSSQLDVDRLDYLNRDSFYTGVYEGKIGADRIIKMLDIANDKLVVEEKAIYSIENFLVSRRLMYWQVYLHKTVISAEHMVLRAVQRARELMQRGVEVPASPNLHFFLSSDLTMGDFKEDKSILERFVALDDHDVWSGIKEWAAHPDFVLSYLAKSILSRKLFKVYLSNKPIEEDMLLGISELVQDKYKVTEEDVKYLMISGKISNNAYDVEGQTINMLTKSGYVVDVAEASDLPNIRALSYKVEKHFVCYPKEVAHL
ncbi:HD domain-containing protein [Pontibacter actiniarum]|uniref:Phosphohydrolase n=1 Tax=Pontibacter actiniarum TaxID=323450 RepID=A0A1X9YTQ0_9BACT|nr:HD domain-containing protein [Pontibacter actiniarum]ARS36184.1 phosphohydrolase [Pontibacter actiniarum]